MPAPSPPIAGPAQALFIFGKTLSQLLSTRALPVTLSIPASPLPGVPSNLRVSRCSMMQNVTPLLVFGSHKASLVCQTQRNFLPRLYPKFIFGRTVDRYPSIIPLLLLAFPVKLSPPVPLVLLHRPTWLFSVSQCLRVGFVLATCCLRPLCLRPLARIPTHREVLLKTKANLIRPRGSTRAVDAFFRIFSHLNHVVSACLSIRFATTSRQIVAKLSRNIGNQPKSDRNQR